MRLLRRAAPTPLDELVRLVGQGDPAALAALRADLPARTVTALRRLLPSAPPSALGVVSAARAAAAAGGPGLRPLAELLLEGDLRTPAAVGELLGVHEETILAATARRSACRAWSLLSGAEGLTEAEHEAGQAHAARCRPCAAVLDGERTPYAGGTAGALTGA